MTAAVFFDVDFTLIYPGPDVSGEGYRDFCARYGIDVDPASSTPAWPAPRRCSTRADEHLQSRDLRRLHAPHHRNMGGRGRASTPSAREIYREWAACQHFELYDDVADVLRALSRSGVRIGLISNTQRCLSRFSRTSSSRA